MIYVVGGRTITVIKDGIKRMSILVYVVGGRTITVITNGIKRVSISVLVNHLLCVTI